MEGQEHATEPGERAGGRPRSPEAHRAILDVILDLLSGYVLYQLLVKPPSRAFQASIDQVLDVVFRGVAPPTSA